MLILTLLFKIMNMRINVKFKYVKCKINININIKSKVKLKLKASMRNETRISNIRMNIITYTYSKKYL